jgi:signal transduction histidine kinase
MTVSDHTGLSILVIEECSERAGVVAGELALMLPAAATRSVGASLVAEDAIPRADAILVDAGPSARATTELLHLLRGRGFDGPMIVLTPMPDDPTLRGAMQSLGIMWVARAVGNEPRGELAATLTEALGADAEVAVALRQARRVFAAGQATLSLQHAINNPLAALMAEAQLLQLDELRGEQRESVDRIVELCRRVVVLVRRLDVLAASGRDEAH